MFQLSIHSRWRIVDLETQRTLIERMRVKRFRKQPNSLPSKIDKQFTISTKICSIFGGCKKFRVVALFGFFFFSSSIYFSNEGLLTHFEGLFMNHS